jgi:HKD family nuclease
MAIATAQNNSSLILLDLGQAIPQAKSISIILRDTINSGRSVRYIIKEGYKGRILTGNNGFSIPRFFDKFYTKANYTLTSTELSRKEPSELKP